MIMYRAANGEIEERRIVNTTPHSVIFMTGGSSRRSERIEGIRHSWHTTREAAIARLKSDAQKEIDEADKAMFRAKAKLHNLNERYADK